LGSYFQTCPIDLCASSNKRLGLFLQNRRHMRELGSLRKTASIRESRFAQNAFCSLRAAKTPTKPIAATRPKSLAPALGSKGLIGHPPQFAIGVKITLAAKMTRLRDPIATLFDRFPQRRFWTANTESMNSFWK
jgi:hypothetical protein